MQGLRSPLVPEFLKMFSNAYSGQKVLVTGHTGFKGSWLTSWLLKLGADVVGVSRDVPTQPAMFEELSLGGRSRISVLIYAI